MYSLFVIFIFLFFVSFIVLIGFELNNPYNYECEYTFLWRGLSCVFAFMVFIIIGIQAYFI